MKRVIASYMIAIGITILIAAFYTDNLDSVREVLNNFEPILP